MGIPTMSRPIGWCSVPWPPKRHCPDAVYYFAAREVFAEPARPGCLAPAEVERLRLPVTCDIDVGDVLGHKLRAMGQHETQARSIAKWLRRYPERVLAESFHRAQPATDHGLRGPRLSDLFR